MFQIIKPGTKIDFIGKSKVFLSISAALVIISVVMMVSKGFNFGIDFAGGTVIQVKFDKAPDLDSMRKNLKSLKLGDLVIQTFGEAESVLIRVEQSDQDLQVVSNKIKENLQTTFQGNKMVFERIEQVGPQVGDDLKKKATYAIVFALIGVLIYIAFRFKLTYAVGAVLALFHDVLITLGLFSLIGKEINLPIIAAVLTIVGYSLNDTIVVFDRIRENLKEDDVDLLGTMNRSINETLSRTVLTSLTTLLAVTSLYLFGGAVINGFAFALLVGVIVGTYSSIGIASSFVYLMRKK